MSSVQDRRYIRHPSDIPIAWKLGDVAAPGTEYLRNISEGGLAFLSNVRIVTGATIEVSIPVLDPRVTMQGVVVWCRAADRPDLFEIGVRFIDADSRFRMRMVEQVCYIEHFKNELAEKEGLFLSGEDAAVEWIRRFAKDFPSV